MEPNPPYQLRVLMFPWLAHSHISPYLELSKQLARRNFYIYLCSTPMNLSSIKDQLEPRIELVELELPTLPNLPPHYHTTRNLPNHLNSTLIEAFDQAKPAFSDLLQTLNPDCLIYDVFQPWSSESASLQNIPAVLFMSFSAACISYGLQLSNPSDGFPFPMVEFPGSGYQSFQHASNNFERLGLCFDGSSNMVAMKTFEEIEGKFMDYLSLQIGKEVVPVGHLVREVHNGRPCKIMEWLDAKPRASVVYASFGSECFLSKEEIEEMAYGLELSGQNFIWVVRFAKNEKDDEIEHVLPSGFIERVGDKGMVVLGWAEQMQILSHSSTGGFLTHCGWGSLLEGLWCGLPLIALPMQYDQPVNARLAVAEWEVAVEIGREDGVIDRENVAKAIRMVMVEEEGEEVRKKAKRMGEHMSCRGEDDIDVFAEKLITICKHKH